MKREFIIIGVADLAAYVAGKDGYMKTFVDIHEPTLRVWKTHAGAKAYCDRLVRGGSGWTYCILPREGRK